MAWVGGQPGMECARRWAPGCGWDGGCRQRIWERISELPTNARGPYSLIRGPFVDGCSPSLPLSAAGGGCRQRIWERISELPTNARGPYSLIRGPFVDGCSPSLPLSAAGGGCRQRIWERISELPTNARGPYSLIRGPFVDGFSHPCLSPRPVGTAVNEFGNESTNRQRMRGHYSFIRDPIRGWLLQWMAAPTDLTARATTRRRGWILPLARSCGILIEHDIITI